MWRNSFSKRAVVFFSLLCLLRQKISGKVNANAKSTSVSGIFQLYSQEISREITVGILVELRLANEKLLSKLIKMSDKISRKSASISTIPDAEITIPDAKINTWYKDGDRRWRVLERETNWEQIDLIPSPIKAGIPGPTSEIPSKLKFVLSINNWSD